MATVNRCLLAALLALVVFIPGEVSAADVQAGLQGLFQAGTRNTGPAVESAREAAISLKRAHADDLRIDYAYGLVLANQRRYAAAIRILGNYIEARPDDLSAQQVKVWAELEGGQYGAALDSLATVGDCLSRAEKNQAAQLAAAEFVGVCFAYLELIEPKGIAAGDVSLRKNAVSKELTPQLLDAVDAGRKKLAAEFAQLEIEREAREQRTEDANRAQMDQLTAELDKTSSALAARRESAQLSAESSQESQRELGTIRSQLVSLAQDRANLAAQIVTLQSQITQLQQPSTSSGQGTAVTVNRGNDVVRPGDVFVGRGTTTNTSVPLDRFAQIQSLALALAAINKQAFDMDRLILSLQTRGAELAGISQSEFKKLSESQTEAEKAAKKAEKLSKQLERREAAVKKRPAGPTGRMTRFSTYAPLPYEQETNRVLSWFEK